MLKIRELTADDDLDAVLNLCREFFVEYENHHEEFFDIGKMDDSDISGRFIQSMESDNGVTIIALVDDKIVGYASCDISKQPSFYKIKEAGVIWGLMVAKDQRRKGIATRLLAEAKAFFGRKGIRYFSLYTAAANHGAIEFYKRNGMTALHASFLGEADL